MFRATAIVFRVPDRGGSLDVLAAEARAVQDMLVRHFEALDTRTGVVLGFAGALVALARGASGSLPLAARAVAAASALASLWAFLPRRYPRVEVAAIREHYADADAAFTKLALLDAHLLIEAKAVSLVQAKARRLIAAIAPARALRRAPDFGGDIE